MIPKVEVWKDLPFCTGFLRRLTEPCGIFSKPVQYGWLRCRCCASRAVDFPAKNVFDGAEIFEAVGGREFCSGMVQEVAIVGDDKKIVNSCDK